MTNVTIYESPEREEYQRKFVYRKTKTAYWDYRSTSESTHTIIFIHGFRGNHFGLLKIVTELPQYRIIVPDLPGFGLSERLPEEQNSAGYVHYLDALIEHLKLDEAPDLLGHSFGSVIVSHFAAQYPEKLNKLILVNPIAVTNDKGLNGLLAKGSVGIFQLSNKAPDMVSSMVMSNPLVVRALSMKMAKTKDKELRKEIHHEHDEHFSSYTDKEGLIEAFKSSISENIMDIAHKITNPTLLIVGEKDEIAPLSSEIRLHYAIKDSQLKVLTDVGHLIHYEKPEEAAEAIADFVG
ncbi:MAG: alpha/beta hydrolase [Micrococcaceae bacterium]